MDADVRRILGLVGQGYDVQPLFGTYVQLNSDGTMTVDVQDTRLTAVSPATAFRPLPQSRVALLLIGQVAYLIGPAAALPDRGTVKSTTSTVATLTTDMGDVTASYNQGVTLNAGAMVKIYWSGGAHVIGALATQPAPPAPPPAPTPPTTSQHTDVFTALDAGTWNNRSGWWQAQVWASNSEIGAWFYGTKIADTIRGGPVDSIDIYLPVASKYGSAPNLGTHNHPSKPGSPSIANAVAVPIGGTGWYRLPQSFGQYLAGTPGGGIGTAKGGFNKFASRAADPQTGALRIVSTY